MTRLTWQSFQRRRNAGATVNKTALVLFIALIALALYDLGCVVFSGVPSSISQTVYETTHMSPIFTFVWGVVVGHLFFNLGPKPNVKVYWDRMKLKK